MDNLESKGNKLHIDNIIDKLYQIEDFDKLSKEESDYVNCIMINNEGYKLFFDGLKLYFTEEFDKAISLYIKSIELYNAHAMNNLAYCYEKGEGVEKDIDYAICLYKKAVEFGNSYAINNLAICYEN